MAISSSLGTRVREVGAAGLRSIAGLGRRVRLPRAKRHRSTTDRLGLAVAAAVATLVVLLVLDGIWAGRAMFRGVSSARSELSEGTVAVVTGDPAASVPRFEEAAARAQSALDAGGHPSIELARLLPWIGDNLDAVAAVAHASRRSATAGLTMAKAADALGWHDLRLPATQAVGAVDLDALERAAPAIGEVASELADASSQLDAIGSERLVGPIATAYQDAAATLRRRASIATAFRDLVALLPRFLGSGADRRYLLAVQTLGRPQGIGGEVDLVGVLTARDGVLALADPLAPAGAGYAQATATGDAHEAGQLLLTAADEDGLGRLDGVVLTDSIWLADAVWATGSVEVAGRDLPVNPDQALKVLEREVFETETASKAAERRADIASAIVESYLADRPATEPFAVALARDVADRHLAVVATRAREQRLVDRLGASGATAIHAPQALAVTWDTVVDNHAVVFARRDVAHRVTLGDDGSARVRTVVTLVNQVPTDRPSALIGLPLPATVDEPAGVNPVGGWAADVSVLLPPKAERVTAETSVPSETETVETAGRARVVARLASEPGSSMSLIIGYRVADAGLDDGSYRLQVVPQTAWPEGVVRLQIDVPPGSAIVGASDSLEVGGTSARYAGTPSRPFSVWVRFA
ncbi:MAG TPA: hypothetical protein VF351_11220 [Actinomycetota bacterium]